MPNIIIEDGQEYKLIKLYKHYGLYECSCKNGNKFRKCFTKFDVKKIIHRSEIKRRKFKIEEVVYG